MKESEFWELGVNVWDSFSDRLMMRLFICRGRGRFNEHVSQMADCAFIFLIGLRDFYSRARRFSLKGSLLIYIYGCDFIHQKL